MEEIDAERARRLRRHQRIGFNQTRSTHLSYTSSTLYALRIPILIGLVVSTILLFEMYLALHALHSNKHHNAQSQSISSPLPIHSSFDSNSSHSTNIQSPSPTSTLIQTTPPVHVQHQQTPPTPAPSHSPVHEYAATAIPTPHKFTPTPSPVVNTSTLHSTLSMNEFTFESLFENTVSTKTNEYSNAFNYNASSLIKAKRTAWNRDMFHNDEFRAAIVPNAIRWSSFVIVVTTTFEYRAVLINWLIHLRLYSNIDRSLVVTSDIRLHQFLSERRIPSYLYHTKDPVICPQEINTKRAFQMNKLNQYVRLIRLGYNCLSLSRTVLISDLDTLWIRDPLKYIANLTLMNDLSGFFGRADEEETRTTSEGVPISFGFCSFLRKRKQTSNLLLQLDSLLSELIANGCETDGGTGGEEILDSIEYTFWTQMFTEEPKRFEVVDESVYNGGSDGYVDGEGNKWAVLSKKFVDRSCTSFDDIGDEVVLFQLPLRMCDQKCNENGVISERSSVRKGDQLVLSEMLERDAHEVMLKMQCLKYWKLPKNWESIPAASFKKRLLRNSK